MDPASKEVPRAPLLSEAKPPTYQSLEQAMGQNDPRRPPEMFLTMGNNPRPPQAAKCAHSANTAERGGTCSGKVSHGLKIFLIVFAVLLVLLLILVYGIVPAVFYWSSGVRRLLLFMAYTGSSKGLSDPESYGLKCSRNFFVSSDDSIRLGAWYVQSQKFTCDPTQPMFQPDSPTVLYIHGIGRDRRAKNRVKILQVLSEEVKLNAVSFDYRGFGDSTNVNPSREGVINDTLAVYKYIRQFVPRENMIVWGHSLGTTVSMYLLAELNRIEDSPSALILEAALDDIGSIAKVSKKAVLWRWMPCFDKWFADRLMTDPTTNFSSIAQADKIDHRVPLMMLHAMDDPTVPYPNGRRLRDTIIEARTHYSDSASVSFISFNASHHFGHNLIPFYPGLDGIIERFLNETGNSYTQSSTQISRLFEA